MTSDIQDEFRRTLDRLAERYRIRTAEIGHNPRFLTLLPDGRAVLTYTGTDRARSRTIGTSPDCGTRRAIAIALADLISTLPPLSPASAATSASACFDDLDTREVARECSVCGDGVWLSDLAEYFHLDASQSPICSGARAERVGRSD
jgi:hypothetical protein